MFRRRWRSSWWFSLGLVILIAVRWWSSPSEKLTLVPEGAARVLQVDDNALLQVTPASDSATDVYRVRLIGLPQQVSTAATAWLREHYTGKTVRLELDKRRLDADGICLAYVYSGRTFINAELIRRNLVDYTPYLGDSSRHAKDLKEAEKLSLKSHR